MKISELLIEEEATTLEVTPKLIKTLQHYAEDGDRIVADGKTIYPGFGNRSGLHSYLATALQEVYDKKWPGTLKKLETGKYKKIEVHEFRNIDRDRGRWISVRTWGG